jgi:hypothetical protein
MNHGIKEQLTAAEQLSALAPTVARIEAIETRLAEIALDGRRARAGYLPKSEITERLLARLRERRDRFEMATGSTWNQAKDVVSALSAEKPGPINVMNDAHLFDLLTWLLWPVLEQSAPQAIARLTYEEGLPAADRMARQKAIKREHEQLVAEHEQLVDQANEAAGGMLSVKHLRETVERRERERARHQNEETQRRRQEEVSRQIEAKRER